jgi:hypothetical protein
MLKRQITLYRHCPRQLANIAHLPGEPPFSVFTTFKLGKEDIRAAPPLYVILPCGYEMKYVLIILQLFSLSELVCSV